MTKLRKYMVYLEEDDYQYGVAVPAAHKEEAIRYCKGNGKVVSVNDITEGFEIDLNEIINALNEASSLSKIEVDYITRTLRETGIAE